MHGQSRDGTRRGWEGAPNVKVAGGERRENREGVSSVCVCMKGEDRPLCAFAGA